MPRIVTTYFYYQDHADKWEAKALDGKISTNEQMKLKRWNELKAKYPNLRSIAVQGRFPNLSADVWQLWSASESA